jgi:hypothetical protein
MIGTLTTPPLATVADHNAAFDPADEALGGAFRAGFREGWISGQSPDGTDYGDLAERYPQAVDIEPSEAWQAHRDEFFAMLPLAAIPEVGESLPRPASDASLQAQVSPGDRLVTMIADFRRLSSADFDEVYPDFAAALSLRGPAWKRPDAQDCLSLIIDRAIAVSAAQGGAAR